MSTFHYRNPLSSRVIKHTRLENDAEFEEHFNFGEALGKGSFGTVTEVIRINDLSKWAVKIVNKEKAGSAAVKLLEREVAIMKKVDHPNIIHLEEVLETNAKTYLIMELCSHGGLEELLTQKNSFTEKESLIIFRQLADAVTYIHGNDIVHRDLKLDNILLAEPSDSLPFNVKLTDFGLSYTRGGSGSDYMMNQVVGTPIYMAPEVLTNCGYSQQCDIWSIGIILYKLLSGEAPFMAAKEEDLFELIKKGQLKFQNKIWSSISQAARQLIEGMMKVDPAHRLTSKEILFHPWIKGQQEMNGSMTTNVLEMMKEYNLEQKRLAKQQEFPEEDALEEELKEVPSKSVSDNTLCMKKSTNNKDSKKSLSIASMVSSSHVEIDSAKHTVPNRKGRSVPSYMQPTKSSKASKNPNMKSKKKST